MANFQFNPSKVPIPNPTPQFQLPENKGTADIIMEAARQSQQERIADEQMKQKSLQFLQESINSALSLRMRSKELKLHEEQSKATLDAHKEAQAADKKPFEQAAPGLLEQYPQLKGMSMGDLKRISPLFVASIKKDSDFINPQEMSVLSEQTGIPKEKLQGVRKGLVPSIAPKTMSGESASKLGMAKDGLSNIADIRSMLQSPNARELIIKAGGSYKKLLSLGDPAAEKLANAIFQVGDAEARIKTGAAINMTEIDNYMNGLVPPAGTMDGILDRLSRKERYFNSMNSELSVGRRTAGNSSAPNPRKDSDSRDAARRAIIAEFQRSKKSKSDEEMATAKLKALGF